MTEFFKAFENLAPQKKKVHTVNIQGKEIEVSLEKKLEIMKSTGGEDGFILEGEKIVPKPVVKASRKLPVLRKSDRGYKFYDNDPLWVESIVEEGFAWQIESE
jgi:hypothetical protein|tara:strand:- start:339 stop:647 length:309 start_codon:yes stop_codon:yes gene_type:complete